MAYKIFPEKLLYAIMLFNSEDFYGQHDVLEYLWINLQKSDQRRLIYQGILNIGVGFYHFKLKNSNDKKNHIRGCQKQLNKGLNRLKQFYKTAKNDQYRLHNKTLDFEWLKRFIEDVQNWQDWLLKTSNYEETPPYPKININI
jgi:predicted metal-dependent hydrolase